MKLLQVTMLPPADTVSIPGVAGQLQLPARPERRDWAEFDALVEQYRPADTGPSLEEIQKQPDVAYLGEPKKSVYDGEPARLIVCGDDGFLAAVLTRLMRRDELWIQVAYMPIDSASVAATNWALPTESAAAAELAVNGEVFPVPLIRDDSGAAIAGHATITDGDDVEVTGEIIVDDEVLLFNPNGGKTPARGGYGARLVPLKDAPGIAAVLQVTARQPKLSGWRKLFTSGAASTGPEYAPDTLLTGRALQAGGVNLQVAIDGVARPRPATRVTFYRHLRDLQIVRPAD